MIWQKIYEKIHFWKSHSISLITFMQQNSSATNLGYQIYKNDREIIWHAVWTFHEINPRHEIQLNLQWIQTYDDIVDDNLLVFFFRQ